MNDLFEKVYQVVRRIPRGRVASYGQIATLLGYPHAARTVGWALRALSEGSGVPWQRVINAKGQISLRQDGADLQRRLLEDEGVVFDERGCVDMKKYRWAGLDWDEMDALRREEENS